VFPDAVFPLEVGPVVGRAAYSVIWGGGVGPVARFQKISQPGLLTPAATSVILGGRSIRTRIPS
jgi:hypothetical protein